MKGVPRESPTDPSPALPLDRYAGEYQSPYFGKLVVVAEKEKLLLQLGPNQHDKYSMQHFNRDVFVFDPRGENGVGKTSAVHFGIGVSGKAAAVLVDHLTIWGWAHSHA